MFLHRKFYALFIFFKKSIEKKIFNGIIITNNFGGLLKMKKSDLIRAIANNAGITLKDASNAFDGFVDAVTASLKEGEKIQISGFGTFELKTNEAREGINPKTGEKIKISATKTPVFKFGKAYKDSFN